MLGTICATSWAGHQIILRTCQADRLLEGGERYLLTAQLTHTASELHVPGFDHALSNTDRKTAQSDASRKAVERFKVRRSALSLGKRLPLQPHYAALYDVSTNEHQHAGRSYENVTRDICASLETLQADIEART